MAQDTTPAIEVYQGDGSNNTFSVHFDKGYYGEIKVAFVKRGLTDYEYDPDTYTVSGRLYAWSLGNATYYTHTPNPAIGAVVYNENDIDTGYTVTAIDGSTIEVNGNVYTRAQQHDIYNNVILTWTGDTLQVGDYICIVRETERGQPYELPINQKQIEGALDNIERQVQELKAKTDNALLVDPTRIADVSLMGPVQWMETILRSIDLSVRELRYYDGWLQYSLDDPKSDSEDKTWYSLLNTTNIKSIYYKYTEDEQGRPLYNVYYVDNTDTERLLTYDAQAQQDDINKLKEDVEINAQNIESEKQVRREADEALRQYIDQKTFDVTQFDSRITQNTNDISALDNRLHETVTALDPAMPKSYIDDRVAGMYHIKGAVDTVDDLPATGNEVGDCWNVIATAKTYLWTEDEEWVLMGDVVDLSPYRTAADQDVIDATKQDILTGSEYIDITNDVVTMTGKFGTSFTTSGTNLILKDQDNNTLSETMLSVGVDAEYTAADEDIEFDTGATSDYSFITERLHSIEVKIPDNASSANKFATHDDIGRATLTIQKNGNTVDTFNANANTDKTINIPVPVNAADVSALPDSTKYGASMVASINSSTYVMTFQLKDQDGGNLGSAQTIDLPLETVVVSGSYDSTDKKIVLTLKDGSTIDIPVGDLISGLQSEITDSNKLSADLVDDTTTTHKFVSASDKTNWNNKVDKTSDASKVYGTDNTGAQTTYDVDSFGAVDDVQVNGTSVVQNKIANVTVPTKVSDLTNDSDFQTGTEVEASIATHNSDAEAHPDIRAEISSLNEWTTAQYTATTTNFVVGNTYTVEEAFQRTASLFEGQQGEIDDIEAVIPAQATAQNQLADKSFVNATISTNTANFRGNWATWTNVPTQADLYPEDYVGNKTPTNNDYMVVDDASDYVSPTGLSHEISAVNLHPTKSVTIRITDEYGTSSEYYYNDGFLNTWKAISEYYSLFYVGGSPGYWYIKTNEPTETNIVINGTVYPVNPSGTTSSAGALLCATNYSTDPVSAGIPASAGQYQGSWRFIYIGTWTTDGKYGWNPVYRIGTAFTQEQQAAIDSGITANMVDNYVNPTSTASTAYNKRLTAVETDKRDIINSANKVYATDANGANKNDLVYDKTATAETIAQRGTNGVLKVGTPVDNADATTKQYVDAISSDLNNHIGDKNNPHEVTKAQVGLGNVDNTSDLNKPISTATQTALNAKQDTLVSGTNIKTINNESLLGAGNFSLSEQLAVLPVPTSADDARIVQYVGETIRTKHEFVGGTQGERTGTLNGYVSDTSILRTKLASIDSELGIDCDRLKFVVVSNSSGYYYDVYACEGATETLYEQNTNSTSAYGIRIGVVGGSDVGTYIYFDMIYDDEYNYSGNFYKCFKKVVVGEKPSAMYVAITNLDLVNSKIAEANETFGITTAKLKFVLTMMGNNQFTVYAVEGDSTEHLMQADINVSNLPSTFGVQIAQTGTWTLGMYAELEYQYYWNEVLELAHLGDVELKDLEDGQALIYDSTTDKWVNGNGGVSATYNATTKTITFA